MKKYQLSDNTDTWTVEAETANGAVETAYADYAGCALEVSIPGPSYDDE